MDFLRKKYMNFDIIKLLLVTQKCVSCKIFQFKLIKVHYAMMSFF